MKRKILRGLQVSEFIHLDELRNKRRALNNSAVQNALAQAEQWCQMAVDPLTQGTFVQIHESNSPVLNQISREVCKILDVEKIPDIYICHLMNVSIFPIGTDSGESYLIVPDYILRYNDEDMLYYNFGNAVTMIKADHVGLSTLASYMPGGSIFVDVPKLLFTAYLHSADSTSDRGGLLACQSLAAAARCQFFDLGIPPSQSKKFFTTDAEAETFIENYLVAHKKTMENYSSIMTQAARFVQRMVYLEAPPNKMLSELFEWYKAPEGYHAVMSKSR